ncbi:GIY-YIG nuclease family protein [Candidatus Gracilibacteria bacterium]|nr:GIY-YIG nuclease family protein [Candidatus Gracilibacteria bacterium]MCF7818972.1 GIY-YIG nuclease family protein [Candidatus Gracilibacteria bacterium]
MKTYYVYILTNKKQGVLYIGVTNNITRRIYEHKKGIFEGFSKKYNLKKLVWFDETNDVSAAIETEKRMKKWKRQYKINVIEALNPSWRDLSEDFLDMDWMEGDTGMSFHSNRYDNFFSVIPAHFCHSCACRNLIYLFLRYRYVAPLQPVGQLFLLSFLPLLSFLRTSVIPAEVPESFYFFLFFLCSKCYHENNKKMKNSYCPLPWFLLPA